MKQALSFKDYLDSKQKLKEAGNNCPRVKFLYEVRKYCKIPLTDNLSEEKQYISLKPKDVIEILWEFESKESPVAKEVKLVFDNDQTMYFSWNNPKILKWVESSTHLI